MALDFDRFCMGCMTCETEEGKPCPNCGFDETSYSPAPHVLPLRTILNGKYLLGRAIGQGGFGILYLGWDLNLDMKLAIKEYYPDGFVTRDCRAGTTLAPYAGEAAGFFADGLGKFIGEAKRLAKFYSLPGIVSVRDYFRENGTAYIIMEFIEGQTLKDYLAKSGGRLSPEEALSRFRPLMDSLAEVHAHDIIHRDISPDNIMMDKAGHFRLIDFGAAREFGGKGSQTILLKPGYAPYEQYQSDGEKQGPWTDVYALCATLYRCITGEVPAEASKRLPDDILKPPSSFAGVELSPQLEAVLMKGLAIFQGQRWQNIGELQAALDAIPQPAPGPKPKPKPKPRPDPKPKPKPDTPKEPREDPLTGVMAAIKALPPRTLQLAAGGCAALVLLVLLLPRLLGGGTAPVQGLGGSGPSSPGGNGTSLAVPPADAWKDPGQVPGQSGEEPLPSATLRQPGDPDAVVRLSDWALEYHLRTALNKPEGDFTAGELAQIQRLHICNIVCTVNSDPPEGEGSTGRTTKMGGMEKVPHVSDLSDLKYFINLQELTLTNQDFEDISALSQLAGLTCLDISGNGSKGMDYSPISGLISLEQLTLADMRYFSLSDLSFLAGLNGLKELVLYSNEISDLSPLAKLTGLQTLDLHNNELANLSPLAGLTGLRELDLSNNSGISDLSPLKGLVALQKLKLTYASANDLSPLAGLNALEELDIRSCPVTNLDSLSGLKSLTVLKISGAKAELSLAPLARLTGLTQLELASCKLSDVSQLAGLTGLTDLDLSNNQLTDLTPLAGMTSLTRLDLENNTVSSLAPLEKLHKLTRLNAANNQLTDLSPISGAVELTSLFVNKNLLTEVSALAKLDQLEYLRIGDNRIASLHGLEGKKKLRQVTMDNNRVADLSPLQDAESMTSLWAKGNPITDWSPVAHIKEVQGRP